MVDTVISYSAESGLGANQNYIKQMNDQLSINQALSSIPYKC